MSALVERDFFDALKDEFQDEDYRYAYDEEFANSRMATQIKVIREQRELKQSKLAELADMKQSRISALEDVNYSSWSVSTLRRLARALGVRFAFGFESWGELLPEIDSFSRESLERPEFEKDPVFQEAPDINTSWYAVFDPSSKIEIFTIPVARVLTQADVGEEWEQHIRRVYGEGIPAPLLEKGSGTSEFIN